MSFLQALRLTFDRLTGRAYKSDYDPNEPISFKEFFETIIGFLVLGVLIYYGYHYFTK